MKENITYVKFQYIMLSCICVYINFFGERKVSKYIRKLIMKITINDFYQTFVAYQAEYLGYNCHIPLDHFAIQSFQHRPISGEFQTKIVTLGLLYISLIFVKLPSIVLVSTYNIGSQACKFCV